MKKAFWLVALFVVLAIVLYMVRSRETFSGPCQYSAATPNTYVAGCSLGCKPFPNLQDAQAACSAEPTCGGITQRPGQQVFELRAGPTTIPSPTGEISWVCTSPPHPAPAPPPALPAPVAPPVPSPSMASGSNYAASCTKCSLVNNQLSCSCDVTPR